MFYNYSNNIDYDTKYKICIAVSGETRNYNTTTHLQLEKFINRLKQMNYEVHVVAHTWAHCELPKDYKLIDEFKVDDQGVIDLWVMEDFLNRAPNSRTDPVVNISSRADIQKKLQQARRDYGQCWSAFRSFNMFDNDYDLLIRWRWDLGIDNYGPGYMSASSPEQYNSVMDYNFAYLNANMRLMINTFDTYFGLTDGTGGINSNRYGFDTRNYVLPTLNDRFMIFNKPAAGGLCSTHFPDLLKQILQVSTRTENYNGHTLWYTALLNIGISMCIDLPQITNVMRD